MRQHGAMLHIGAEKTVVFSIGPHAVDPVVFFQVDSAPESLATGKVKRWLGYMWDRLGGKGPTLDETLHLPCRLMPFIVCAVLLGRELYLSH